LLYLDLQCVGILFYLIIIYTSNISILFILFNKNLLQPLLDTLIVI